MNALNLSFVNMYSSKWHMHQYTRLLYCTQTSPLSTDQYPVVNDAVTKDVVITE